MPDDLNIPTFLHKVFYMRKHKFNCCIGKYRHFLITLLSFIKEFIHKVKKGKHLICYCVNILNILVRV